jgi:maltokinase
VIDVHGDLHVGQVLRFADRPDYAVVDFDGNPIVPPDRRADRQPAAVDVAGMLASLDHVGRVVVHRTEELDVRGVETVETWIREARGAFLRAYREGLAAAGRPELLDERLLRPLLVVQECREYLYAVRHLPHWVYVPDKALPALLAEG